YRWEAVSTRWNLLAAEPPPTGDEHWDIFLAALAEHLAARDHRAAPGWAGSRSLRRLWFPFNTRAARVDAVVHAPAAFRRRGIYVAAHEVEVAGATSIRSSVGVASRRRSVVLVIGWPAVVWLPTSMCSAAPRWPWPLTHGGPRSTSMRSLSLTASSSTRRGP